MAIKKTELYSSLWASCDELRGWMDASPVKSTISETSVAELGYRMAELFKAMGLNV